MGNKKESDWKYKGVPYKIIVISDGEGKIKQVMQKPKIRQIGTAIHVSGCHLFLNQPEQNHWDHWYNGQQWKEYMHGTATYPLNISGTNVFAGTAILI